MAISDPERGALFSDVAGIVSRSRDLNETLGNTIELVAKRLGADACSVYLMDPDMQHLSLAATRGLMPQAVGRVRLALGEGLVGRVAAQRRPQAFARAVDAPGYRYFPETGEERFRSLMAAPLLVTSAGPLRDFAIGVLVVQSAGEREFTPAELALLATCAQLVAPVVMNSQLLSLLAGSDEQRSRIVEQLSRAGVLREAQPGPSPEHNVRIHGMPTSRGIAVGPVCFLADLVDMERVDYTPAAPEAEQGALRGAIHGALAELHGLRDDVGSRFGPDFAAVFNIHIQILEDKGFTAKLESETLRCGNALQALRAVLGEYERMFGAIEEPYFRERGGDVQDVGQRVMARLLGVRHEASGLAPGSVVVVANLLPALFAAPEIENVAAIVAEHGGPTSHGAIFARALEIPAVTGASGIFQAARAGDAAIVDGQAGNIFLSPDASLRAEYQHAQEQAQLAAEHLDELARRPAKTLDGHQVRFTANVGLLSDLPLIERHGAEGVGLFRTELLALVHRGFPSEEEQERLYTEVAAALAPRPVTIRTLDLGGDKAIPNLDFEQEQNPQLGWRSIRLSLDQLDSFRAQIRAILRASAQGNVRLLLPMISSLDELHQVRSIIEAAKGELRRRGAAFDASLPVGVMIEVPSAALIAPALARECDFFSIGTNDLTQYTLAVDRSNERVAHLYDSLHPAVLALIARSLHAAEACGIPVALCGEMAGRPLAVPILVGLGLSELSCVAASLPVMKEIVRALHRSETAEDARRALAAGNVAEVHRIAATRLRSAGLLSHPDIGGWLRRTVEGSAAGPSAAKAGAQEEKP